MTCGCTSHNGFLTSRGLREVAQRSLEGLEVDAMDESRYLDKVGSVSGARRDETDHVFDDQVLDEQYRRFLEQEAGNVVS